MAESSSPVVARWELSRRLAARRKELGIDVKTITNALGFTRNYWSAVENDRTLIAEDKLRLLFDVLSFDESDQSELLEFREDARKKGWWERAEIEDLAKRFFGLEDGATRIRVYESLVVPGLLQTDSYARAVIASDPFVRPVQVEPIVEIRRRRQELLEGDSAMEYVALVSEAVLRQQFGDRHTHVEQIRRIRQLASSDRVHVRVAPFNRSPGVIAGSSTLVFLTSRAETCPTSRGRKRYDH